MEFARDKHVRYWRMCSQNLPDHYISNDSSRMTLGFFIVSALDLLGALDDIRSEERQAWILWIYSCQVPEGGFRGFTGTDLGQTRSITNQHWDPANVPATFFALETLLILGDDLSRVNRQACLTWLPTLQRDDGSFGEILSQDGTIEGDHDLRQCCCAAGIAYILQDRDSILPAFNQQALIDYIQSCQNHDGGFGVSPLREPHSGLSYCAVAALSFIQKLSSQSFDHADLLIPDAAQCISWFLERQTTNIDDENEDRDEDEDEDNEQDEDQEADSENRDGVVYEQDERMSHGLTVMNIDIAGFNGRDGKIADTCYCFWNTGSLAILGKEDLVDSQAMKQYLLEVTQHRIGGFGKGRGDPPDILHSYLGLAALSVFGHAEVKALDPTLCISRASALRLDKVSWKRPTRLDRHVGSSKACTKT